MKILPNRFCDFGSVVLDLNMVNAVYPPEQTATNQHIVIIVVNGTHVDCMFGNDAEAWREYRLLIDELTR